jgi:hypothetical protein
MSAMKPSALGSASAKNARISAFVVLAFALLSSPSRTAAQSGSIEFAAYATPSGGVQEPVRGFPFYLLRKSFADIGREADASTPKPDQDAFIDKLDVSKELKAWMKKNHTASLSGDAFLHKLHSAEIMDIPEFFNAYMERNSGDQFVGFPKAKYKASDQTKDPAKYAKLHQDYLDAIRHFIDLNPQTIEGVDLGLADIDPGAKWDAIAGRRSPEVKRQTMLLAQSKYLVASTQTDLQGQGFFRGVAPGVYYLSTLDVSATVGDARPRWDVEIRVQPSETAHAALSEANAVQPASTTP